MAKLFKTSNKPDEFILSDPNSDNEASRFLEDTTAPIENIFDKPGKKKHSTFIKSIPVSKQELQLRLIFWVKALFFLWVLYGALMLAGVITVISLMSTETTTSQFKRAVTLMDRVYEMHDYTKTMVDVTTQSQKDVQKAIDDYGVVDLVGSVKDVVIKAKNLLSGIRPETIDSLSTTGVKLADTFQKLDFEQGLILLGLFFLFIMLIKGKQLMMHVNEWASLMDPHKMMTLLDKGELFLQKGNEMLHTAAESNVVNHVANAAANAVDLEARLARLNEITIKLPSNPLVNR